MEELSALDQKFWDFHEKNPKVFKALEDMTYAAYSIGRMKIGMKMMFEVLRWNSLLDTSGDPYKLNNSYCSRYARILIDKHPEYKDMFETRRIHS